MLATLSRPSADSLRELLKWIILNESIIASLDLNPTLRKVTKNIKIEIHLFIFHFRGSLRVVNSLQSLGSRADH